MTIEAQLQTPKRTKKRTSKNAIVRVLTHKVTLISLMGIILILGSGATALALYTRDKGTFLPGITVAGIDVGNMTKEEAKAKVQQVIKNINSHVVKFDLDGQSLESGMGDLGLSFNADQALSEAYAYGRSGNLIAKAEQRKKAQQGIDFKLIPAWNEKTLTDDLTKLFGSYQIAAKDASFTITPNNTMQISKEADGKKIDITALAAQVQKLDVFQPQNELKISFQVEHPKLTAALLEKEKITGRVASYTTNFDPSQTERTKNVRLAAEALDGTVIAPGETFSFNKTVGERTAAKGYEDAYIIVNGEFVEGLGGGICQVSSTLYNSVLLANLPIAQRTNHDLAITYVPLGQDATVAWPTLDFKFQNNSNSYLLIRTHIGSNQLTIDLYGQPQANQQVIINDSSTPVPPPVQKVMNPSLSKGQERIKQNGIQGYKVTTTRTVLVNGKEVKKEELGSSYYEPTPKIIEVGPDK